MNAGYEAAIAIRGAGDILTAASPVFLAFAQMPSADGSGLDTGLYYFAAGASAAIGLPLHFAGRVLMNTCKPN